MPLPERSATGQYKINRFLTPASKRLQRFLKNGDQSWDHTISKIQTCSACWSLKEIQNAFRSTFPSTKAGQFDDIICNQRYTSNLVLISAGDQPSTASFVREEGLFHTQRKAVTEGIRACKRRS